ncbi:SDR family oxidoreductase [Rossellomorea vietnamensis]|uniref:SDR family oxidoreductase n=1 Tax=Rossellomorea vietnamensis TaxID=218284 RepID=UPI003CF58E8C
MYPVYPYYAFKQTSKTVPVPFPPQHQRRQPGLEYIMVPRPISENPHYKGSDKLKGKVAVITGGDSGIGRAAAYAMAKEGADIVFIYLDEHRDAHETKRRIEEIGRKCLAISGDLRAPLTSIAAVEEIIRVFGKIDILVNNCAVQYPQKSIMDITEEQLEDTFRTNIFSFFYMTKAVLPHLKNGSSIINTASITAYRGNKDLVDYSSTKGAIVTFTRSLSLQLIDKGIRVNAVAPGPVWTPLIPSSFSADKTASFGLDVPMKRAGQPFELAPSYVYLASDDSRYVSGQVLHVNGGAMVES